jgi:hypothetical protein
MERLSRSSSSRGSDFWVILIVGFNCGLLSEAMVSVLQALKTRISNLTNVKKFLQPGSQRKPPIDQKTLEEARKAFKF